MFIIKLKKNKKAKKSLKKKLYKKDKKNTLSERN